MALRILTILVRFGVEQYARAEQEVDEVFQRFMPTVRRDTLVVDNALSAAPMPERSSRMLIAGDNSAREFSAFDRAVRFIGPDIWLYDLIHFATSAFNQLHVDYLERFSAPVLAQVAGRSVCLGHIDRYNDAVEVLGVRTQHWIRTGFFMMPPSEVKVLGSLLTICDGQRFFSGDPAAPFRVDAPLDATYRRYLIDWLTGADIGQGVTWHSRFALTPDNLPAFEHKAISILNEHLLAVRLRAMGCRLIDVSWLATLLASARGRSPRWDTPWEQQLAARHRGALVLSA